MGFEPEPSKLSGSRSLSTTPTERGKVWNWWKLSTFIGELNWLVTELEDREIYEIIRCFSSLEVGFKTPLFQFSLIIIGVVVVFHF
jgi:hypothetical protein